MTTENNFSSCANCGKGEEESVALKNCVACRMVKYCGRDCQKAHRPQHKKECRKRAAELHDEALFKQPPPREDCPICFLRLPTLGTGTIFKSCCGKVICSGCIYAGANMDGNADQLCPFCRTPAPISDEENIKLVMKRVQVGDAQTIHKLACNYAEGRHGLTQNRDKALELWHQAGELSYAASYYNIGNAYFHGHGVERDEMKAMHYWELAAMGGEVHARNNLGCDDHNAGNMNRALKHLMIALEDGDHESLKMIQRMCSKAYATKDDYSKALQVYQSYLDEIKSDDRDKAAAFNDEYIYYE